MLLFFGSTDPQIKMKKAFDWLKRRWKALIAFVVLVISSFVFYLKGKGQKDVLDQANKSHAEENKANENALRDLEDGLNDIREKERKDIEDLNKTHDEAVAKLEERKKELIDKSKDDEDLAKKIADKLGVEFVDTSKK